MANRPVEEISTVRSAASSRNSTADRAIDILFAFDRTHPVLSAAVIADRLGMSRSTTYRYLHSLRRAGLIEDDASTGGFRLGRRIFELAEIARRGVGLRELSLPVMQELGAQTNETVLLTRRSGDYVVCVERVETTHPIRLSYEVGHVLPSHAGASAKVLLAYAPHADLDRILRHRLERFTANTITDQRKLRAQLQTIRRQGYSVSRSEVDEGVVGVAAPILSREGMPVAGLSVVGLDTRLTEERVPRVVEAVRAAADRLAEQVGPLAG